MKFPTTFITPQQSYSLLSAIEHAALVTGQPCSGTPWLDEMIRAQRRERLAGQIAAGPKYVTFTDDMIAERSVKLANALISALEGGAKW